MTRHAVLLSKAAVLALLCAAAQAKAATGAGNRITGVELSAGGKLAIHGTGKPSFTVFKLADPPRLVVDLAGADITSVASPLELHQGGVVGVTTAQFDEASVHVARVVIALAGDVRYDAVAAGNDLLVQVGEPAPAPRAADPVLAKAAPAPAAPAPAAAPADPNLVSTSEDAIDVAHPARRLSSVSVEGEGSAAVVRVRTDGEIGHFTLLELKEPGRLAFDLHGVSARAQKAPGAGPVSSVRVAKHDDGVRVVLDGASGRFPQFEIARRPDGLDVKVGSPALAANARAETGRGEVATAPQPAVSARGSALVNVHTVDLRTGEGRTEVAIALDGPVKFEVTRPDARTAVLTLHGAALPERLERNVDATALGGDLTMLSAFRVPGKPGEVRVIAALKPGTRDSLNASKTGLSWKFGEAQALAQAQPAAAPARRAAAMAAEQRAMTQSSVLDDRNYTGRRADFNLKDIDIKNLLGGIAEISKRNIIVADDVKGTVTIKLRNVPWDQALDIILKAKGLGKEEIGNIIRVAPIERLRAEQKDAAEAAKIKTALDPLKVRLIPVNYATAAGLVDKLKDALSERGTVSVDTRTNTLIVKDVQDSLIRAEGIVRNLDTQTPEVLIESRIVEASTNFSRSAGIQWGGNVSFSPTTGNPTGLVFPNIMQVAGAADDGTAPTGGLTGVTTPNFAVNMPTPIGAGAGGGLGFIFGSAGVLAGLRCGREHHLHRGQAGAEGDRTRHPGRLDPDEDQRHQQPAQPAAHRRQRPAVDQPARGEDRGAGQGRRHDGDRRHLHPRELRVVERGAGALAHPDPGLAVQEEGHQRPAHRAAHLHHAAHREPQPIHRRRRLQRREAVGERTCARPSACGPRPSSSESSVPPAPPRGNGAALSSAPSRRRPTRPLPGPLRRFACAPPRAAP